MKHEVTLEMLQSFNAEIAACQLSAPSGSAVNAPVPTFKSGLAISLGGVVTPETPIEIAKLKGRSPF
jgi:hypothetical protein